jgi:hypothetical protein
MPEPSPVPPIVPVAIPDPFPTKPIPEPPTSNTARAVALVAAILLAALAILWQNLGVDGQHRVLGLNPPPPPTTTLVYNPLEPAPMMGKFAARLPWVFAADPTSRQQLNGYAVSTPDRIIVAAALAEVFGPEDAAAGLRQIEAELRAAAPTDPTPDQAAEHDALIADAAAFALWYDDPAAARADADAQARLESRYSYFARLAATLDDPSAPDASALRAGGLRIVIGLVAFGLVVLLAALAGFALFVFGVVRLGSGSMRLRGVGPVRTSSVFLETYALFVAGFLAMSVGSTVASSTAWGQANGPVLGVATLVAQWCLLVTPLWPLLRGMPWLEYRTAIGLHRGTGAFREIGAGVLAYLAGLPLFFVGVLITLLVLLVQQSLAGPAPAEPPNNEIVELIVSADTVTLILIVTLATVWAPVCEELIFRGALFRHLRARTHWTFAAFLSALLFAYMHSYGPLMVAPLVALGVTFAFMREWRGSLIAAVTAHALHNGTLMLVMLTVLRPLLA